MSRYIDDERVAARPGGGFTVTTPRGCFQVLDLHAENLAWVVLTGDATTVADAQSAIVGLASPDHAFDLLLGEWRTQ